MTANQIKDIIKQCATLFEFEYQGLDGNVDPYFHEDGSFSFLLYFDNEERTVYNIDDVMSTPFIKGKSLNEVAESLKI
jgi:hypothetical protein